MEPKDISQEFFDLCDKYCQARFGVELGLVSIYRKRIEDKGLTKNIRITGAYDNYTNCFVSLKELYQDLQPFIDERLAKEKEEKILKLKCQKEEVVEFVLRREKALFKELKKKIECNL